MARSTRLLDLVQILRGHRYPVSGATLAAELKVSLRTLYRDIATLQAQGADIEGEPGLGYVLKPGFMLPPLMFTEDEIEALALGARWVASRGDGELGKAANQAIAKIAAVLPADLKAKLEDANLLVAPAWDAAIDNVDLSLLRQAIRNERIVEISYADVNGQETERAIWPFALGYFEKVRMVVSWCELRQGFRHFRTDRIRSAEITGKRYPRRRAALLKDWRIASEEANRNRPQQDAAKI